MELRFNLFLYFETGDIKFDCNWKERYCLIDMLFFVLSWPFVLLLLFVLGICNIIQITDRLSLYINSLNLTDPYIKEKNKK